MDDSSRIKILAIDDRQDNLSLVQAVLSNSIPEASVITALSGRKGIELAFNEKPDVILLDLMMPEMDGFQVCREIKNDDRTRNIPVVIITGLRTDRESRMKAITEGADMFLARPFDDIDLTTVVLAMARIKSSSDLQQIEQNHLSATLEKRTRQLERDLAERRKAEMELQQNRAAMLGLLEDMQAEIENRRIAEEQLRQSQENVNLILNSTAEGIYGLDMDGTCTFCNEACITMLRYGSKNDLVGKHIHGLIHYTGVDGSPTSEDDCLSLRVLKTFEPVHSDREVLWREDGSNLPVELWSYPIWKDDRVIGAVVTFIDISERKNLEKQLFHSQKMEPIGTLAGGIAHDFNNILSAIIGYGHVALMQMSGDSSQRPLIEGILKAAKRAADLTKQLLAFGRKQFIDRKQIDLNASVKDIQEMLARIIGEDIVLKLRLHKGDLPVMGDRNQLAQVLMNFAANARDAMPHGGSFLIETDMTSIDDTFIETHGYGLAGEYARLAVTDTGIGMDEETKQRVFEPFFTTKETGKGSGLGLSVLYGIIKQHDGYICVDSKPGEGTTFSVYLPLAGMQAQEGRTVSVPEPVTGNLQAEGGGTILVAEDNEALRTLTKTVLTDFGYEVIEAVDGEEAVEKFIDNKDRIRLLLFDLIMPRKNGRDAFNEIREIKPGVPVIFSSGYASDMVMQKGIIEEGICLIYKPVSPLDLLQKVRQILHGEPMGKGEENKNE